MSTPNDRATAGDAGSAIRLYSADTPNGLKIPMALEELGLPYDLVVLDLDAGEQHLPEFLQINPNGRIPAMLDASEGLPVPLFESGAILLHLAERHGALLPAGGRERADALGWLFLQVSGLGPAFGQARWFARHAVAGQTQAVERFRAEARRLARLVDERLRVNPWLAGQSYSVADIAHFCWLREPQYAGLDGDEFPAIRRWCAQVEQRPATRAALGRLQAQAHAGAAACAWPGAGAA